MPSCLLSAFYLKVTVLFNINFTPTSHQTRHTQWKGKRIFHFSFFVLKRLYGYYSVANCANLSAHALIFVNVPIFKIFSYFCLWKNKNKARVYIIWTSMSIFFWNSLTFFQKLPSAYIFINCTNLWNFVNCFQHLSEFHQIIKHFYNFLKSEYKIFIIFL